MTPCSTAADTPSPLPPGWLFWQRGWLSANNLLCLSPDGDHALVDSGYCAHSDQTLQLVQHALGVAPLPRLINTHLHSDHCGGNAALQAHYPHLHTRIPPGEAEAVRSWDDARLSYRATGQACPRFTVQSVLEPSTTLVMGGRRWHIESAPGHDPHAVLLHEPLSGILMSGDALWNNGFGVVFPEIDGERAFEAVGDTLDLIERLQPRVVVPGHGPLIVGSMAVQAALVRARSRLHQFIHTPLQHTMYGAKVLIKFKLMEQRLWPLAALYTWAEHTPLVRTLHQQALRTDPTCADSLQGWVQHLLAALARRGAATVHTDHVEDAG